jgi:hypothetical protein
MNLAAIHVAVFPHAHVKLLSIKGTKIGNRAAGMLQKTLCHQTQQMRTNETDIDREVDKRFP